MCLGVAENVHTIPLTAYIQETVAPKKMGRAFSVLTLISSVPMPVGLLFSSPIAEKSRGKLSGFHIRTLYCLHLPRLFNSICSKHRKARKMIREFQTADTEQVMQIWLNGNEDAHPFISKKILVFQFLYGAGATVQAEVFDL